MDATRAQKIKFAKDAYKKGTKTVAGLQKVVKAKFGTGISFRDIGQVFPASSRKASAARKAKAASKSRRKPGRPKGSRNKTTGARRGRPPASARDSLLLMAGDDVEVFSSSRSLEARVAELLAEGYAPGDLSVYEKTKLKVSITHQI